MPKFLNPTKWQKNTLALWAAFLLPALIMTIYFAMRHMAPFGNNTILTVDLGQQYIDFFVAFKHMLTQDPSQWFYSFSKGLGGETYGDWAYYLFSPLNLLLLPFSNVQLPAAILGLTVIKYGLTSWAFAFALHKMRWQKGFSLIFFGVTYAFMGWFVANQLNLLWLDAAILLPLIILGLEKAIDNHSIWWFVLPLTAIMIINYYMAYMIGLFLVLYIIWRIFWEAYPWKTRLRMGLKFTFGALISIGLSCFAWLPTAYTLMNSKSQYMLENLHWRFDYFPPDFLGKFFVGTFNFDQMPSGLPNIFIGSLPLILFWFFITSRTVRWQVRVITILITAFLVVSMMYGPLNLLWHGFQFPVWYPYRFSFIFCFWIIWLGASIWQPRLSLTWLQAGSLLIIAGAAVGYLYTRLEKLNFLDQNQLIIGSCFFLLVLLLMTIERTDWYWQALLGLIVVAEMTCGALLSLNNFSYLSNSEYQTYIRNLNNITKDLKHTNSHDFFRVAQTFQRTKGDPFQGGYNGGSAFSSALEYQQSRFMALIGQSEGDNYVDYSSGTIVSDSILSMRYLLQDNRQEADRDGTPANTTQFPRQDTDGIYEPVKSNDLTLLSKNPYALPVGFAASQNALNTKFKTDDPIENQERMWNNLNGYQSQNVFDIANFTRVQAFNTQAPKTITGTYLSKDNTHAAASVDLYYKPTNNNPYYLTLGSDMNDDNVEIQINGQAIKTIPDHRHTIILPLPGKQGTTEKITLIFKKKDLWLQNVSLYQGHAKRFAKQAQSIQQHGLKLDHVTQTKLSGKINMPSEKTMLMTSIPNTPGWQTYVDGKQTDTVTLNKFFIGVPMKAGEHRVTFKYVVPLLKTAVTISIGTLLFMLGLAWSEDSKRQHRLK
ncbi:putative membrane protein YfhO [Weissella uvarum]|uniref:YfhO family protein n=1 Tax=Weissella uvarum TaxID=1479233 RepID=UPI0019600D9B|nr:YfhO family protein [Weissella uvarum]MBM7616639.1 putative membrane protein YfhO [Weissella uvarum]MCM0594903.1 YfhO family protein [Weissella uvarum]